VAVERSPGRADALVARITGSLAGNGEPARVSFEIALTEAQASSHAR
jgi:hypothetical protein